MTRTYRIGGFGGRWLLALLGVVFMTACGPLRAAERVVGRIVVPHPYTTLLRSEAVSRELGLSAEQVTAVSEAVDGVDVELWRLRDRRSTDNDARAMLLLGRLDDRLNGVLSVGQKGRLRQLVFQAEGLGGVLADGVAVRLRLRGRQRASIEEVVGKLGDDVSTLQRMNVDAAKRAAAMRAVRIRADRDILAMLDDWQRGQLPAVAGRAFDLSQVRSRACRAPELKQVTAWINSGPLRLGDLRGEVVIVHFYTYGCINCKRNLPHYNAWQEHFGGRGVRIVGIHRPETKGEYDVEKVRQKAAEAGIEYAVAVDNDSANWDAWANCVWPSVYAVDKEGFVRFWWYGELNWRGSEGQRWFRDRIEELAKEK